MAESPEAAALRALAAYLTVRYGAGYVLRRVRVEAEGPDHIPIRVALDPLPMTTELAQAATPDAEQAQPGTVRAILDVMGTAEKPLKGEAIARRAGKKYNPHFRRTLSQLKREGTLRAVEGGYWLAARPVPDADGTGQAPDRADS